MKRSSIAIALSIAFVIGSPWPGEAQQPIRIGATMSQSGVYSTQGGPARNGYLLCQKHVNDRGGILGRKIELLIYDDKSDTPTATGLYEKLIADDKVDLVLGPYGVLATGAMAVTEKHRKVLLAPLSANPAYWEQGRRYLFMQLPPADQFLAGLIDMADRHGLKTVALVGEDTAFPKSVVKATVELAKKHGMTVVLQEEYAKGNEDFSAILAKVKATNPDLLAMTSLNLSDFIGFVRQMKERDVNVKMFGTTGAVVEFQRALGSAAEFTYGTSPWEPSVTYPGVKEFVDAFQKEFNTAPSFHAAGAYAACQLLMEAVRRAGSLDSDALRDELLKLKTTTILNDYAVDERGLQIANKGLFVQWQDGTKVVVWPDASASAKPRFPTPTWGQR